MRKIQLLVFLAVASYFLMNPWKPADDVDTLSPATVIPVNTAAANMEKLTRLNFESTLQGLYENIGLSAKGLDYNVFRLGMIGYYGLKNEGALSEKDMVTIIDFSKPSTEKRIYVIDLAKQQVRYHTYVAHGRNTGQNLAASFSNKPHSNQSSLGFYVTGETYVGSKGFSLRLDGKERSFNDKIRSRAVVIHAAEYATEGWIKRYGRLGRSQGCPALPPHLNKEIINTIKNKTAIFTYYPDDIYLNTSRYLRVEDLFETLDREPIDLVANRSLLQSS